MNISKFQYLAKTLSRTKRKDYENYVVNAIYNRIGDARLVPISQQYVINTNPSIPKDHYFIDLYFPQLNIGVECDEAYHTGKEQEQQDKEREITIIDVLKGIKLDSTYKPYHIKVSNEISFEDIESQINNTVTEIKMLIKAKDDSNGSISWEDVYPANEYETIQKKGYISVLDNVSFPRIVDVDNIIFGKKTKNQQHSYYTLNTEQKAWFPKLAINDRAVSKGWNNKLSSDGSQIIEYNEKTIEKEKTKTLLIQNSIPRVTFVLAKDLITSEWGYRFVGVFKETEIREGKHIYTRISEEYKL